MTYNIDLKELSLRESEKVEWKKNGDDLDVVKSIAKTICAFANDIANMGGGYVVCGTEEIKDEFGFPKLVFNGLSADKLKEIEGKVLQYCRDYISPSIAPIVAEIENPDNPETRILVFTIHADRKAHSFRDGETTAYYVRISRETREARNGIFQQLMENKQEIEPFDKRSNPNVNEKDIDTLYLREYLIDAGIYKEDKPIESYISDTIRIAELVPPLCARKSLDGGLCLKNFALLMFGRKESMYLHFEYIFSVVSFYNGTDRSDPTCKRYEILGTILEQARKLLSMIDTLTYINFDKESDKPNKEKYPRVALQEAIINAIVHRDYQLHEPIRITVFSDRIEIYSPGALHWSVDKENFKAGKAGPFWRNQSFAYLFNKLELTQSEGQGISTIIRSMKAERCPEPVFDIGLNSVTCILYASKQGGILEE